MSAVDYLNSMFPSRPDQFKKVIRPDRIGPTMDNANAVARLASLVQPPPMPYGQVQPPVSPTQQLQNTVGPVQQPAPQTMTATTRFQPAGSAVGPQGQQYTYAGTGAGFTRDGVPIGRDSQPANPVTAGLSTAGGGFNRQPVTPQQAAGQQAATQRFNDPTGQGQAASYLSHLVALSRAVRDQRQASETDAAVEKERRIRELPLSAADKLKQTVEENKLTVKKAADDRRATNDAARITQQGVAQANLAASREAGQKLQQQRLALQELGLIDKENAVELDKYENLYNQSNDSIESLQTALEKSQIDYAGIEQRYAASDDPMPPSVAALQQGMEQRLTDQIERAKKDREKYLKELTKRMGKKPKATAGSADKSLDETTAKQLLQQAGGDKDKARELARAAGYTF